MVDSAQLVLEVIPINNDDEEYILAVLIATVLFFFSFWSNTYFEIYKDQNFIFWLKRKSSVSEPREKIAWFFHLKNDQIKKSQ